MESLEAGEPDVDYHNMALECFGRLYRAIEYDNMPDDVVEREIAELLGEDGMYKARLGNLATHKARLALVQAEYFCKINKVTGC